MVDRFQPVHNNGAVQQIDSAKEDLGSRFPTEDESPVVHTERLLSIQSPVF
jgi:hypothetical protein